MKLKTTLFLLFTLILSTSAYSNVNNDISTWSEDDFINRFKEQKPLADKGDAYAQHAIGLLYGLGRGTDKDMEKAIYWLGKAAEQGDINAKRELGLIYYNGHGVIRDYKKAAKWYKEAAKQGDAKSQYKLALMYRKGEWVLKDYRKSIYWYEKSAEQDYRAAQLELGLWYISGSGIKIDIEKGKDLISEVYENGDAKASKAAKLIWEKFELWKWR